MELFLIRHAQSANNARPEEQRIADPPLTDLGQEQSRHLATCVASLKLTKLIASPFLRTLQTAERIRRATELEVEVRIQLHEQGGCYSGHLPARRIGEPGMNRAEISREFPKFIIEAGLDGEGWWRRQAYETEAQARTRAKNLLRNTCDEFARSSERVAYVMHGDIKVLLLQLLHPEPLEMPRNASISSVSITPAGVNLIDYNQIGHLPAHLITH